MIEFFLASENTLYTVAVALVLGLGLLEGLGLLLGWSVVAIFDNISPFELDFEVDTNAAEVSTGGLTQILGWLCLNRLPLLIWIVLFLCCFAITGYLTNYTIYSILGMLFPPLIIVPAVFIVALFITGRLGHKIANIMPQNESSAVSTSSFAGCVATITTGTARYGSPAEASLIDDFKHKHYLMVEPIDQEVEFPQGSEVVLVQKNQSAWQVVGV